MMKKFACLLVCVLLCAACLTASAAQYNAGNLFQITYDETLWQLDDVTYLEENTGDFKWLFMLYRADQDILIDMAMEALPEFEGLSLFSATTEERTAYVEATMDVFQDNNIKLMDTITVSELDIPFYLYSLEDADGAALMAETVVSGWALHFTAYHQDSTQLDDDVLTALDEILGTFVPVT